MLSFIVIVLILSAMSRRCRGYHCMGSWRRHYRGWHRPPMGWHHGMGPRMGGHHGRF